MTLKKTATTLANSWGMVVTFKQKRTGRKKRFFDELCEDERLADPENHFKTSVLYACLDIVIAQLTLRFDGMRTVATRFRCIQPSILLNDDDDMLYSHAQKLAATYNKDLSADKQLLSFRTITRDTIQKISHATIKDMAEMLIVKYPSMMTSIPDVATAFKIFLTLPVAVASTERSFSKLN